MIEIERCPKCNANLAMVGRSHRCVPMPEWAGGVPKSSDGQGSPVVQIIRDPTPPRFQQGQTTTTTAGTAKHKPNRPKPSAAKVRDGGNVAKSEVVPDRPSLTPPCPSEAKPKKRAPAGTFDRKAYQREYMRKRRAQRDQLPEGVSMGPPLPIAVTDSMLGGPQKPAKRKKEAKK